ncbi:MAG: hypothetical protein NWE90_02590 [Candidatus Bathyarchaeota archaeon]|nr:hypothetical protein [Candidatus Bathyarchaeota archaeon]
MSLRNEDRELQIELARLQMRQQYVLGALFGLLAAEFSVFGVVYALYFMQELGLTFLAVWIGLLPIMLITIWFFSKLLDEIEAEAKKLKKKYVW